MGGDAKTGMTTRARCSRGLSGRGAYRVATGVGASWKCLACALVDRRLVLRSGRVALLVGSVLVILNQGDALLSGTFPWRASWFKLPLTFLVPYCVATYGALANAYGGRPRQDG